MRVFGEGVVFWGFISRATPKNDFIQRGPKELHSVNVGPHTGFEALLGCVVTLRVIRGLGTVGRDWRGLRRPKMGCAHGDRV